MLDSESKPTEPTDSPEPSRAPSPNQPFNPGFGLREIESTYDAIVRSRQAIIRNEHWCGNDVQPIAMLLAILAQMEGQYRSQLDRARADEKDALKRAKEEIQKAGGTVNGGANVPAS